MDAPSFTDSQNREWPLAFTIGYARAIKVQLKLDFANVWDGKALAAIGADRDKLVSVLWHLCQNAAAELGVSEEQFLDGFTGDVIEAAEIALEEAIVLFCQPARRPAMRAALEQARKAAERIGQEATDRVSGEKFATAVDKAISKAAAGMDQKLEKMSMSGS